MFRYMLAPLEDTSDNALRTLCYNHGADLKKIGVKGVMIGRAAVRNPAIFDLLKGKKTPTLEALKKEYVELSKTYGEREKYSNNVLKRLGKELVTTNENG